MSSESRETRSKAEKKEESLSDVIDRLDKIERLLHKIEQELQLINRSTSTTPDLLEKIADYIKVIG